MTVPEAFDSVAAVPAVTAFKVTRFPAVPCRLNVVTVCVVPEVRDTVQGWTVLPSSEKVFDPAIVIAPAPAFFSTPKV